jgi:hypothetical protein
MKTYIIGLVISALLTSHILSFFTGLLVQVVGFDDDELELGQVGKKTIMFGTVDSLHNKLHSFK